MRNLPGAAGDERRRVDRAWRIGIPMRLGRSLQVYRPGVSREYVLDYGRAPFGFCFAGISPDALVTIAQRLRGGRFVVTFEYRDADGWPWTDGREIIEDENAPAPIGTMEAVCSARSIIEPWDDDIPERWTQAAAEERERNRRHWEELRRSHLLARADTAMTEAAERILEEASRPPDDTWKPLA